MYFVNYGVSLFFSDLVNSQHFDRVYTLNALMPLFLIIQTVKQGFNSQAGNLCNNEKIKAQSSAMNFTSLCSIQGNHFAIFHFCDNGWTRHQPPLCIETCTKSNRESLGSCHWHCGKQKQPAISGTETQGRRRWPCVHCQGNGNTLPVVGEWSTVQGASYNTAAHLK